MKISPAALALIIDSEGVDQPGKWPGGQSGITLGYGYDLMAETKGELVADWGRWLTSDQIMRLSNATGKSGEDARKIAARYADIFITNEAAAWVLANRSLPKYEQQARRAFPGFDVLPQDAQGSLVSLVYNRGTSMGTEGMPSWSSRKEMRDVRDAVKAGDLARIAKALRDMKRLWGGNNSPGLVTRREREAQLVESCIPH